MGERGFEPGFRWRSLIPTHLKSGRTFSMNLEYQGWICVLIQFLSHTLGLKIVIFYS